MGKENEEKDGKSRRDFLRTVVVLGGVATIAAVSGVFRVLSWVPPKTSGGPAAGLQWPRVKVANTKTLTASNVVRFNYPLVDTPNILVKLGTAAEGGTGPDGDIVAFSGICQHLGCYYAYVPEGRSPPCNESFVSQVPQGFCCCHGGQYDFTNSGKVIGGPPPRPVPQVKLEYEASSGNIYAVGMGGPTIFGKGAAGTTDPQQVLQSDLQGGEVVTDATVFQGIGS